LVKRATHNLREKEARPKGESPVEGGTMLSLAILRSIAPTAWPPRFTRLRSFSLIALLVLSAPLSLACHHEPPLDVAPGVDLQRFQGKWYEIAKLPRPTQANCQGTLAFYRLRPEGSMDVVNECHLGQLDGPLRSVAATAKVTDPRVQAKLSVDFGGFFGDYWILEVGEHYEFAVVGHPSRDYLWILSRNPMLDEETRQGILRRASANGFDVSRLESTPQLPAPAP
jgi:apolipoprotein D and lipocalin family protein